MGHIPPRAWVSPAEKRPHCSRGGIPDRADGVLQSLCRPASPAIFCFWQETRLKEGIVRLQPQEEPLRSELLSGKFTVLVRACAIPEMEWSVLMEYYRRGGREGGAPLLVFIFSNSIWWLSLISFWNSSALKEWEIGVDGQVLIGRCASWTSCVR